MVLLDTNALTALWHGDERILEALDQAGKVLLSVFVLGELHAGFRGGCRLVENRARLNDFLGKPPVEGLEVSAETSEVMARSGILCARQAIRFPSTTAACPRKR